MNELFGGQTFDRPTRPPSPDIYECTQFLAFEFADPSPSLTDKMTEVARIWASTLKTFLESEHTKRVIWASMHQMPNKAKLYIDWNTTKGRETFEASSEAEELRTAWGSVTSSPVQSTLYHFLGYKESRGGCLTSGSYAISVTFIFKFNDALNSSQVADLDVNFQNLTKILRRNPTIGVHGTYCAQGWELNNRSYCTAVRCTNADRMQSALADEELSELLEELRGRATGGVDIEYFTARVFESGWHGSVEQTHRPPHPSFVEFMANYTARDSAIIRGVYRPEDFPEDSPDALENSSA